LSAGITAFDDRDSELLALPSSLAGYEPNILLEAAQPFRPAWMSLAEYRTAAQHCERELFCDGRRTLAAA
jgi:hypothetical protein